MGVLDGTKIMRGSVALVRRNAALLWFPVISTVCLAVTAGFWILWGTSLYETGSRPILLVPLAVGGLYSLSFLGVFFSVALAAAAAEAVAGSEASVGDGIDVAFDRLGGIAGWAAVSILIALPRRPGRRCSSSRSSAGSRSASAQASCARSSP